MKGIEKDLLILSLMKMSKRNININNEQVLKLLNKYFDNGKFEDKLKELEDETIKRINKKI